MKKKGLIISTIVMVIVLVASLTTATYAWFSSNAQATVEQITVQTVAVEGLQVAVKNGTAATDWVTGQITYSADDGFGGDAGWGSLLDFSAIATSSTFGQMTDAVTTYTAVATEDSSSANIGQYYVLDGTNFTKASEAWSQDTQYYVIDEAGAVEGQFLVPTGYDSNVQPTGYTNAVMNSNYLDLPIGVKATADMDYILCTITLTPIVGSIVEAYQPGMAAASRILIEAADAGTGAVKEGSDELVELYSDVQTGTTGFQTATAAAQTYSFVVAKKTDTAVIGAGEAFLNNFTIWIEGTDGQCIQLVAGSGFNIDIDYSFVEVNGEGVTATTTTVTVGADADKVIYQIVSGLTQDGTTVQA